MKIQDLCINQKTGELSEELLDLSKICLRSSSPLYTTSSPTLTITTHKFGASYTTTKSACRKRKYPIYKKSYVVSQSNFLRIAPKLFSSSQTRHTRSCPYQKEPSPPQDRSPHAGALFRPESCDTQSMTQADLLYMRMTPAERVACKLPGTFVFQAEKCKQIHLCKVMKQSLTCLATPTKEIILRNQCSSIPPRRNPRKSSNFHDFIAAIPQPPSLPPHSRLLEHALRKELPNNESSGLQLC
jgi:hypothetical protein